MVREPDATMQPTLQDNQLMSKHRVLSLKPQLRPEWRGQDGQSETEQPDHSASLCDSITSSTRIRFSVHTGGVWKFLSFLFCCFSLVGAASVIGIGGGILAWVIAWIFTAIAAQSRRSEERFSKMERSMLAAKAAEEASSPVGRLLQIGSEKRSFVSPRQLAALVLMVGLAAALILTGVKEPTTPRDTTTTTMAAYTGPAPEFVATADNEPLWRADNPPKQWPKFTVVPGEKPLAPASRRSPWLMA
jgi:hypothetical protein